MSVSCVLFSFPETRAALRRPSPSSATRNRPVHTTPLAGPEKPSYSRTLPAPRGSVAPGPDHRSSSWSESDVDGGPPQGARRSVSDEVPYHVLRAVLDSFSLLLLPLPSKSLLDCRENNRDVNIPGMYRGLCCAILKSKQHRSECTFLNFFP